MSDVISVLRRKYSLPAETEVVVRSLAADFKADEQDEYKFTAQITAETLDRDDEVLLPTGCDASSFDKSGMLFWNHDYNKPIGFPGPLKQSAGAIIGTGQFMRRPADYQGEFFPDFARAVVTQAKALGRSVGVSVGFIPVESRNPTKKDRETWGDRLTRVFSKWKLLEWSIAPVQSNPDAFTLALAKGLVTREQVKAVWGIDVPVQTVTRRVYILPVRMPAATVKPVTKAIDRAVAKAAGRLYP